MFLDTSGLVVLFDCNEPRHEAAKRFVQTAPLLLIHNYVLAEFVPLVHARRLPRQLALNFMRVLMEEEALRMIWVDRAIHDAAVNLLDRRRDKTYSLCDAVSFVVMDQQEDNDALTTDRHFEQEGFKRLLEL